MRLVLNETMQQNRNNGLSHLFTNFEEIVVKIFETVTFEFKSTDGLKYASSDKRRDLHLAD